MKEQLLLYGVCAAITVVAVAVTSFLKIVVCAIAKRGGKSLSGNVKDSLFTPIAILLAAGGEYLWLEVFMHVEDEQLFILLTVCFSIATMLIYWLLFQPTRKAAVNLIRAIAKRGQFAPIVEAVEQSGLDKILLGQEDEVHSNAESELKQKTAADDQGEQKNDSAVAEKRVGEPPPRSAEEQLRDMVNALKQN